jgi:anti-sigma factor RsiW
MNAYDAGPFDPSEPLDPSDPFAADAGAYLLGALSPDEERAFAAHLAGCDACAGLVAGLRPTIDLLANVTEADLTGLDDAPETDESLLPALLQRAAFERRRRRNAIAALGAVAAAAVIALAVVLGTQPWSHAKAQPPTAAARPMVAVAATVPLSADAALSARSWGTQISLDCHYRTSAYPGTAATYQLEVLDRAGTPHKLGSWTVRPSGDTRFTSGTSLQLDEISEVRIDLADGTPVLQLTR